MWLILDVSDIPYACVSLTLPIVGELRYVHWETLISGLFINFVGKSGTVKRSAVRCRRAGQKRSTCHKWPQKKS